MEGSLIKKAKSIFEHSGEFDEDDEVTFTFPNEDNNQLFYSKFILSRCSPVFKAMFKHDFKEKKDKNVIIEDIKVADFKTFFKWCDPMLSEHLTAENVLQMVEIAEKYQIEAMIQQCRKIMHHDIVDKTFQQAKSDRYFATYHIDDIVKVLLVATKYNYTELLKTGEDYLVCFEVQNVLNTEPFEKLPIELKYRILSKRICKVYETVGFKHV
ncbi:hypothetical protein MAR_011424 [Mya arenaria]|uniref:BTB domain-containing protein n=1 Tax=Mya arenaria TaxID=6604 RepID=A0ABY7FU18_MYAAR|nr:kelch-like protein diablo isoform X1 [Mya arenaria]WAR25720.1 hypothetical protein MAR_011424 [Mya arenaria]